MKIRPGLRRHVGQQVELLRRQVHRLAIDTVTSRRATSMRTFAERELVPTLRLVGLAPLPAQHRLDAGQQLRAAERLRDVVVGADLEADDPVDLVALGREDDHRRRHRPRGGARAAPRRRSSRAASRRAG